MDLFSVLRVIVIIVIVSVAGFFCARYYFFKKNHHDEEEEEEHSASVLKPPAVENVVVAYDENETPGEPPKDPVEELYPGGGDVETPLLEIDDDRYEEILKEEIRNAVTERLLQEEADDMLSESIEYNLDHYVRSRINTAAAFSSSIGAIKSVLDPGFAQFKLSTDFEGAAARVLDAAFEEHSPRLESCLLEVDLQDFMDGVVKITTPPSYGVSPTYTYADKNLDVKKAAAAVKPGEEVGLHIFFNMKRVSENEVVGGHRHHIFIDDKDLFELTFRNNLGYDVVLVREGPSVDRIGGLRTNDTKKQSGEDKSPFYIPDGGIRTLSINASHTYGRLEDGDFRKVFFSFLAASLNGQNGSRD